MPTPTRRLAFQVLRQVGEPAGPTLAERLAQDDVLSLDPRERAFLHELVLGTFRTRGLLDHALRQQVARPLDRIDPPVLAALRLGAHQILGLRVPDRAAVSESVDLAREAAPWAAGFVNAVLRRLSREGPPPVPGPATDPLGWLTSAGSLPAWLAERWLGRLGPETAIARARAFLLRPPDVFRVNPRVPDGPARVESLAPRPLAVPGAFEATAGQPAALAREGVVYLQDEGSQMVAHLAASRNLVLDACAAPGGKSTLLADLGARVVAADVSPRRLQTLRRLVQAWGAEGVRIVGADSRRPPFRTSFDSVLLDAPCSGLGTLARHPDIRWKVQPSDLRRHAERQRELLHALARLVTPGGTLVYSTCSLEPEENEEVMAPFLEMQRDFLPAPLPEWSAVFADGPFLRKRPEGSGGDGFFAARLRRKAR